MTATSDRRDFAWELGMGAFLGRGLRESSGRGRVHKTTLVLRRPVNAPVGSRRVSRAIFVVLACAAVAAGAPGARAQDPAPVYRDTHYSFEERAADLVSRLTLEEKATQLSTSNAPAIPRLGVQEYAYWSEAQHGLSAFYGGDYHDNRNITGIATPPVATSFPTNLSASLTWDRALMRRETSAISDEARGFLDHSLFGNAQNNL